MSVDNKLATGGISSISELHDHENCASSGEENMRAHMTLHMCWVLLTPMLPMKVLQHCFVRTPLASMMNWTVWTWNWCCFIWNMRFQLNSCHKFLWKEEWFSHRYSTNVLFFFGGPGAKCIILILCFLTCFWHI